MEAVNIYTYSRIQEDMATEFENILSQRSKKLAVKVQEFAAIKTLVDLLLDINIEIKNFENFFASFTISGPIPSPGINAILYSIASFPLSAPHENRRVLSLWILLL